MNKQDILDTLEEFECLVLDDHKNALLGIGEHYSSHGPVAIYDINIIVQNLVSEGMSEEEAEEYYQFNILDGFVAENQPIFCRGLVKTPAPARVLKPKKTQEKVENSNRFGKILDS